MLSNLDIDVILQVLAWLHVKDILSLRRTSKHFYDITRLRIVWRNALTNLIAENIPLARISLGPESARTHGGLQDFSSLSAEELEVLALATYHRARIWEGKKPTRTRATRMRARAGRVFGLRFLRLRSSSGARARDEDLDDGRYLLSLGHTADPTLCMQVWDVDDTTESGEQNGHGGRLVAEWGVNGRVIGHAVDEGNGLKDYVSENNIEVGVYGTLIAVSARDSNAAGAVVFVFRILVFAAAPPDGRLAALKSFPLRGPLNVRAMSDRLVAVQVRAENEGQVFGHGVLKVIDWVRSTEVYAQAPEEAIASKMGIANTGREFAVKLEPSVHGVNRAVLHVHFAHDWVFVFRESVLELYFLPSSLISNRPRAIYPGAFHKWDWQVNTLTVTERVSWVHGQMSRHCRMCDGSGIFSVSAEVADEVKTVDLTCACRYRPLSIVARFDSYFPWPVNLLHHYVLHVSPHRCNSLNVHAPELPFVLPPQLTQTVPSTVRLFGHSVLVLGSFGTLVWTDSEANNSEEGQSGTQAYVAEGTGERVAGRRIRLPSWQEQATSPDLLDAASRKTDPSSTAEVPPSSVRGQRMQNSVFATRLTEGWYSLALCESRGRIAIGDGEGTIELWDHF